MELNAAFKTTILEDFTKSLQDAGFSAVLLSHFGSLDHDLINSLSVSVEEMMIAQGDKKALVKRVFSILIEGLQNSLIHGALFNDVSYSLLIIGQHQNAYRVVLGNVVLNKDMDKLNNQVDKLNNMDEDEVKAYYLEVLNNGLISEKGGAGLGFITMRMKSKAHLSCSFMPIDNQFSFFTISSDLERING